MSAARLWWVRHGPTHAKGMVGWTDLPADLSDTAALARLSGHLPARAHLVSSDLRRARTTADALAGARRRLPDAPGLREIHFGTWESRVFDDIAATDGALVEAFWADPGPVAAPGGESWDELATRVGAEADRLAALGGDIVVVAHFGAILSQVARARAVRPREVLGQYIENLSVTRIDWDGHRWYLGPVNHRP